VPDIDLTTLIPQLDSVASDIVAHQRDTLTQRKDLAQKTKDFRKLDDASKLNDFKALLKCKQACMCCVNIGAHSSSEAIQAA
jgi:homeobox protein cut-like